MSKPCRFCLANNALRDAPLFVGKSAYVLAMQQPDRPNACMVIPQRHIETPFDLGPDDLAGMAEALAFAKQHLAPLAPDGYTVGWNVGAGGGQHMHHAHLHVIARFDGDADAGMGLNALIKAAQA